MIHYIYQKWQQSVSKSPYSNALPFFQRNELVEDFLGAMFSTEESIHLSLTQIIDFVESNGLDYHNFINTLFLLRDICNQEISYFSEHNTDIQNTRDRIQETIIKVSAYFAHVQMDLNLRGNTVRNVDSDRIEGNLLYLDHNFNIVKTNSALLTHFGFEKPEVLGKPLRFLFSESSQTIIKQSMANLKNNLRFKMEIEVEAQKKDLKRFQALLKISRLNIDQAPAQYSAYIKDNTYIHETKSVLNLLSMALESAGEGVVIFEPSEPGNILYVNEAMEEMSGHNRRNLLGRPLATLRGDHSGDDFEAEIIKTSLEGGWIGEITNYHREGHSYLVYLHTQPIKNEYGKIVALVGIERDITQDKSRQDQIIHLKQFVERIINNLPHFVIVTDVEQTIKFWNQSLEQDLGISSYEAIGKNIFDILPELNRFHLDIAVRNVIQTGEIFSKKILTDFQNLGNQYYQLFINPIKTDRGKQLLWTILNITKEEFLKVRITWQNARLKFLENFSQLLNTNLDLKAIFQKFTQELREILPYKSLSFLLPYEIHKLKFTMYYNSESGQSSFPENEILSFSNTGIYRRILDSQEPQIINLPINNTEGPLDEGDLQISKDVGQVVYFPICFENEILGILNIGHAEREYYKKDDLDFIQQIASHLAIALKNSFYFNLIEIQNRKLFVINSIFNISQHSTNIPQIYETAQAGLKKLLQFEMGTFYISSEGKKWQKFSSIFRSSKLPEEFSAQIQNTDDNIHFWNRLQPPIVEPTENTRFLMENSGIFCWEYSKALGHLGFLSVNNVSLTQLGPETITSIVQDVLKQMTIAIDQLHLFDKVQQAEKEWETTFDTVNMGLAVLDKNFKIIRSNHGLTKMFGYKANEHIGLTCRDTFCKNLDKHVCLMDTPNLSESGPIEAEYFNKEMQRRYRRVFYPMLNARGKFNGGVISIHDITTQRDQEKKIRFLSKFPETNPNLVISLDKNGKLNYINPAAQDLMKRLSLPDDEVYKILPGNLKEIILSLNSRSDSPLHQEHRYNEYVFEYVVYRPVDDENFYFYGTDVTEKVGLQKQLLQTERIRAVGELAAGVAHDFNNLLATILGRTQLLLLKIDTDSFKNELKIIEKAAIDGGEIVQRIQEITREKRDKSYVPLYLNEILEESLVFSANKLKAGMQLKGKKVKLTTELFQNPIVMGNPVELKEVFTNLFINAYDAMPEDGELTIKTELREDQFIQLVIQDTGTGMSEEVQSKIFNPFFTTKGEKGTGLGLSIVYNTIAEHSGNIRLESKMGVGSTFTILLPICEEPVAQKHEEEVIKVVETIGDMRLMIVDDEPELLLTMAEILRLKFKQVDIAGDGPTALTQIKANTYDVILTDLGMPDMSGWELAKKAKESLPDAHIIMVTGWGDQAREELKHHPYVDGILSKPYELKDLFDIIQSFSKSTKSA